MNAVEIEQALTDLAAQEFVGAEFPFQFLAAFGNKATTLARLRKGDSNASDVPGGVLQRNHIHLAVAEPGQVGQTLANLKASPKTSQGKVDRFRSECDQPEVPANARPPSGSRLTAASGRSGTRPGPRTDPGTLPARPKAQRHPVASRLARDARGFPPAVPSGRGLAGHDLVGRVGVPARQHRARAAGNDALQRARRGLHGFRRHHAWIRRDSVVACGRAACRRGDPAGRALARK